MFAFPQIQQIPMPSPHISKRRDYNPQRISSVVLGSSRYCFFLA